MEESHMSIQKFSLYVNENISSQGRSSVAEGYLLWL